MYEGLRDNRNDKTCFQAEEEVIDGRILVLLVCSLLVGDGLVVAEAQHVERCAEIIGGWVVPSFPKHCH